MIDDSMTVTHTFEVIEDKIVIKSKEKQQELREVAKIKMQCNRTDTDYVTDHSIIHQEMIFMGC